MAISSDSGKEYVLTGKDGRLNKFTVTDFQYTAVGKFIIFRLLHDRDVKIVITGKGKSTGTGKTTLAIILAWWINTVRNQLFEIDRDWNAEDYSFLNVWDYLGKYGNSKPGDVLITDELEYMADRRRSMSEQNVKFSVAWSMLRYKNVITIGTCPHFSDVDKRIPEGADIWINVTEKGRANSYYMVMDDFTWDLEPTRFKMYGYRETIRWGDIGDTEDYKYLKNKKKGIGVPGVNEDKILQESDLKNAKRETKKNIVIELLRLIEEKDLQRTITQADIGKAVGYSQPNIAKIKRQHKDKIEV